MLPPSSFRLLDPLPPQQRGRYDIPPVITRRPRWRRLRCLRLRLRA